MGGENNGIHVPSQFNGQELGGEARFDGMVVDKSMLEVGADGTPLAEVLTNELGEEGWRTVPHPKPSRWVEQMAGSFGIELFAVEVLPEGAKHVRQQRSR